jgi:hypothetical protein
MLLGAFFHILFFEKQKIDIGNTSGSSILNTEQRSDRSEATLSDRFLL